MRAASHPSMTGEDEAIPLSYGKGPSPGFRVAQERIPHDQRCFAGDNRYAIITTPSNATEIVTTVTSPLSA